MADEIAGPSAVVVGLGSIIGLQTARILNARGVRVVGVTGDRRHFAARTRTCAEILEADVHGDGFLAVLERIGPKFGEPAVLVPCTDHAVLAISRHRARLAPWYRIVLPAPEVVHALTDKTAFAEHAQRHRLPIPRSYVLRCRADAELAAGELGYPSVLKPAVKSAQWKRQTSVKAVPVADPDALLNAYDRVGRWADALIAQEFIGGGDGRLYTFNGYFGDDGRDLITFVTRKRRQWPPHLGVGSYAEECHNDEVLALALRLFASVPFRGLGYVECKRDPADGRYLLIEANIGRPTGRSAMAEAGGVELLYTTYCHAAGLALPARRHQRHDPHHAGAVWVDVRRDILSAAYHWRRGELTAAGYLSSMHRPKAHAVWSARDPLPFAFEIGQSAGKAARRMLRGARGAVASGRVRG